MAGGLAIKAGKGGHKNVPTPGIRPDFVLGSRPQSLRQSPVPRIKPAASGTRDYGKQPPSPGMSSFGDTGQLS
jgi:hypothetical protein